jgi:hypothetical protein
MFKKILFSLTIIAIAFLTGYATAQSLITTTPNSTTKPGSWPSAQIMTPSDFQSQTEKLQQQKNDALTNQLKENLAKVPPPTPPTPPPSPDQSAATPETPTPEGSAQAAPTTTNAPAEESAATAPASPTHAAPAKAPATQENVYTGFQNTDQNQKQPAPVAGSGGWNIKY